MANWRERFLILLGPGLLPGITLGDWIALLRENRFRVQWSCWPRAVSISWQAALTSLCGWYENRRYAAAIERTEIKPPLFVLGHWRSGTTRVHDLLSLDARFAVPTMYQSVQPHTFLSSERTGARLYRLISPGRRPHDNMRLDPSSAWEDEFVMCVCGFRTPYLAWAFPHRAEHYDKYLTFRDASAAEIDEWRAILRWFLQKLTLKHGKPLILKSPTHTCRIRLLLEMFPEARFVHIHRHPYAVFKSSMHMHQKVLQVCRLQRQDHREWVDRTLRQYREMYDAYFEERGLIPAGRLHELSFAGLEATPVEEVRRLYAELGLPDFAQAEAALRRYVDETAGYQKNEFPQLEPALRGRIADQWRRCFEEWGYAT